MWWRLPWIRQRYELIALAAIDGALLAGVFNIMALGQYGYLAGTPVELIRDIIAWLTSSYLLGRYSRDNLDQSGGRHRRVLKTIAAAIATYGLAVLTTHWSAQSKIISYLGHARLEILAYTAIGSGICQLYLRERWPTKRHWVLIGSKQELSAVTKDVMRSTLGRKLTMETCVTEDLNDSLFAQKLSRKAIAISTKAEISNQQVENLLRMRARGTRMYSLVTWCEIYLQRVPPELLSDRWLIQAEGFGLQIGSWSWRIKRFADVIGSSVLLVGTTPLLLFCALAIWAEDQGPVLYNQQRNGLYGTEFTIWKLRSMNINAEESGAQWSSPKDKRITKVGYWLRRFRVDELPQLINVMKGEMSLIGPRPERPEIEEQLKRDIPHYEIRNWVRPGLSGWAQVCHPYGASLEDSRSKLSYDIYYLRNAGWLLDGLIILKTLRIICSSKGSNPTQVNVSR